MELRNAKNHRLTLSFARASDSHELHWILADLGKFPTHRAVQQHSLEIVEMSLGSRSQVEPFQPLLDGEGFYLGNGKVAPARSDLVVEVGPVRAAGRVPQLRKLCFKVPVHEHADRDRVSLRMIRVHIKLAVFDDPPRVGFGFEHCNGTDDFGSFCMAAIGLSLAPAVHKYESFLLRRPGFNPTVLIRVSS